MHRLDLRGWKPGDPVKPEQVLALPKAMLAVNGCCSVSPETILVADCFGGAVWRVDFSPSGASNAKLWLKHETMAHIPDTLPPPPQPGINGIRYSPKTNHVYYTTTGQKLFTRVAVDPATYEAAGEPEPICGGGMYDDFCVDEARGCAYLTVHRENRIDRAPLEPQGPALIPIAGHPLDPILLGPSSAAWSRAPGEEGRVAFITSDGGHTAPPEGGARTAKVLRMELI